MRFRIAFAALVVCLPAVGAAQEAPPGALACTGCHDASVDSVLSLKGLSAEEIATAVAEMRTGARESTLMYRIAAGFTDAEIEAIAQWLAREE
jgi:cytochrome subunit of sulfide dehydrogenase